MIRKIITEMDKLSYLMPDDVNAGINGSLRIDYGRGNDEGVLGAYAYFYGKRPLDNGERYIVKPIYVDNEKDGGYKMFIRGELNPRISTFLQELIRKQVLVDLMNYLQRVGHRGFAPLMKYSLDMNHGITRNDFVDVLRETGFKIPGNLFKSDKMGHLFCLENDSEICILPSDQLLAITDEDGNLSAYLTKCQIVHSHEPYLHRPPIGNPPKNYIKTSLCETNVLLNAWNDYIRVL